MCILCIIGIIFIFTNKPYANEMVENNIVLESIKNNTFPKYKIGTYKISENEINIEILGSSEYYNSVKNEIENIVKNTIKYTDMENYSIRINHNQISQETREEKRKRHELVFEIYTNLNKLLSKSYPNQIDKIDLSITTQKQLFIEVKTTINQKQSLTNIGEKMEKDIYTDLENNSNEITKENPIKIYIYNKDGKKIN